MRKQQVQYKSSLDALIAVAKRLSLYESQHNMDSEDLSLQESSDKSSRLKELWSASISLLVK